MSIRSTLKGLLPGRAKYALRIARERYWDITRVVEMTTTYRSTQHRESRWWNLVHAQRQRILFYPELPPLVSVAYKLAGVLGYGMTQLPECSCDVVFLRRDRTWTDPALLQDLPHGVPIVNGHCHDISKQRVGDVFERVFGYALGVDPCSFEGECVAKSNTNYTHDGRIIQCPIAPRDVQGDMAYQRVVDNVVTNGPDSQSVLDYRVPIHGEQIPLVYLKYRPVGQRFSNENTVVELARMDAVFRADEIRLIQAFAREMGMDYGELDVLRDRKSDRIYIVDANKTPSGPPNGLSRADERRAIDRLASTFHDLIDASAV